MNTKELLDEELDQRLLLKEEGEDEEEEETDSEEEEDSSDEESSSGDDEAEPDGSAEEKQPFDNLDLNKTCCFGYSFPVDKSWKNIAESSLYSGWNQIDVEQLEKNLSKNVANCYARIAQFELTNLDDDMKYVLFFDNNKGLWDLQLKDSPKAEIDVEERGDFFKSDMFKKISKRTFFLVKESLDIYNKVVNQHVSSGELLLVDEIKLSAILHFIEQKFFLENIKLGKYLNY